MRVNIFARRLFKLIMTVFVLVNFLVVPAKAEVVNISAQLSYDTVSAVSSLSLRSAGRACPALMRHTCAALDSVGINHFSTDLEYREQPGGSSQNIPFKVPYDPVRVNMVGGGGEVEAFMFRMRGVGGRLSGVSNVGLERAGCSIFRRANFGNDMAFFLGVSTANDCNVSLTFVSAAVRFSPLTFDNIIFSYELSPESKSLRGVKPGTYNGEISFSVGRSDNAQIGLGGRLSLASPVPAVWRDEILTIRFTLTVLPVLRVDIPAGGNRVELAPLEGWQRWLQHGRLPTNLVRTQHFSIWASSPFRMSLECHRQEAGRCVIERTSPGARHFVPVSVSVSLPSNFVDQSMSRVVKDPLSPNPVRSKIYTPKEFLDRSPASLIFEVDKVYVDEIRNYGSGTYSGIITVLWETTI